MAEEAFDYAQFEVGAYSLDMDLLHVEYLEASRPLVQNPNFTAFGDTV